MRRALVAAALAISCSACAMFRPALDDPEQLAEWEHQTVTLRELEFQRPVGLEWLSREELPAVLQFEAEDDLDPVRVTRERDSLAALGALEPDVDLRKEVLELYSSQVSGLYSMKRDTLYVLDEMAGVLMRVLLDPIVVHELTHALQDQNFPQLLELMVDLKREDDLTSAFSSVIEGDATVTMLGALPGAEPAERNAHTLGLAEQMRDGLLEELEDPDSEVGRAPRLLGVGLVFPYAYGTVTAARRYVADGNAGLDAELLDPPLATLHVVYPETRGPVDFIRLPLESLGADAACTPDEDNVAGALLLRVLFEEDRSSDELRALLEGWRGDRYVRLDCGEKWELFWVSRWESREAAERFAAAYGELTAGIAERTRLSGPAQVVVRERAALVVTPGLAPRVDELLAKTEVRSFDDFKSWLAAGCFPAEACPIRAVAKGGSTPGQSD